MRSFHLNLAAAGLVTVSVWMILHRSGSENTVVCDARPPRKASVAEAVVSTSGADHAAASVGAKADPVRPDKTRTPLVPRQSPAKFAEPSGATTLPDSATATADADSVKSGQISGMTHLQSQVQAIQLGEDVRLPAAIMALNDPGARAGDIPPAVVAATKEIEKTFYRELADKAVEKRSAVKDSTVTGSDATEPGQPADHDTVILNDHDVYDARERADSLFRTIHGDAAASRQGISSALEVLLPKDAGSAQP